MTSSRPSLSTTLGWAATLFVAVLALLAWQVAAGRDPALDAKRPALASVSTTAPRRVLVRVIHRRVIKDKIVYLPPAQSGASTASAPSYASAPAQTYSAPAQSYSAPAPVAAAPAPAPAPAPVQTATS